MARGVWRSFISGLQGDLSSELEVYGVVLGTHELGDSTLYPAVRDPFVKRHKPKHNICPLSAACHHGRR